MGKGRREGRSIKEDSDSVWEKKTRRTGCSENGVQGTKGEHPEGGGRELATSAAMPLCCRAGMGRKGSRTRAGENAGTGFLIGCFFFFFVFFLGQLKSSASTSLVVSV
jgi:hypothetical protein